MERKRIAALKNLEKATEANRRRNAERPKSYFSCKTCGVAVICKPSHVTKKSYCSNACMAKGYKTRLAGRANPNFRGSGERLCAGCSSPFKSYNKARKYCSMRCYRTLETSRETSRMNGRKNRKGGRCDLNQPVIVGALRAVGASVLITANQGGGFPDLVVGWRGANYLLEVKNPTTSYGRQGFNKNQKLFNAEWGGSPPIIVRTPDEALQAIGATK